MAFDDVRIALADQARQALERGALGFLDIVWIDDKQLFPPGVIRERDAHDVIVPAGVIPTCRGYKDLDLHSL